MSSINSRAGGNPASSVVKVGGMDFVRFAGGPGRVGSSDFSNNPVRDFTAPPVLVGRDLVSNYEIDAYVSAMADQTHGIVAVGDRMHLLARGRVDKDGSIITVPEASIVGSPDLAWAALASVREVQVRVVPQVDRLQGLSAAFTRPDSPACRVSLYEALGYCAWKSEMTGKPFMIPDEWLWEWIATNGAGPDRKYPWGNEEPDVSRARFNSDGPSSIGWHPSREGVNDLAGNLSEWTMSPFQNKGQTWSMRGGAWNDRARCLRAAFRDHYYPSSGINFLGFRVVVPLDS